MARLGIAVILVLPFLAAAQSYNLSALFQSVLSPGAEIHYANDSSWAGGHSEMVYMGCTHLFGCYQASS